MKNLLVVVLAYNEVNSLNETVDQLISLKIESLSRIVISTSKNADQKCQKMATVLENRFEIVQVHFQEKPFVAAAVLEVIEHANEEFTIYMSADGETPTYVIPTMISNQREKQSDIVSTSRWIEGGSFEGYGRLKQSVSYLTQRMCKVVYGSNLTEFTYGYRLYRTEILKVCKFREDKHPFFLETLLIPIRSGYSVSEVAVNWIRRREGKSVVNLATLLSYLRPLIRVRLINKKELISR